MSIASIGKLPEGARLQRIQQSPNYRDGAFVNQVPTTLKMTRKALTDVLLEKCRVKDITPKIPLPSVKTDLHTLPAADAPVIVWFGHSSYLIAYRGITILVDPVFSGRASPVRIGGKAFEGTNIYQPEDLPHIDILLQTHDHYDHLDHQSIVYLKDKVQHFVTPLGVGAHLEYWGVPGERIQELDWQEACEPMPGVKLRAMPARHFSGRGLKRNQTLWASYILELGDYKLYLGGDSGYAPHFKEIGELYGPFDIALLECGQYNLHWHDIHLLPEETAQAAKDLQAKVLMPVHWARFGLAIHSWHEPMGRLAPAAAALDVPLATPRIGEPVTLTGAYPHNYWWQEKTP